MKLLPIEDLIRENHPSDNTISYDWLYRYLKALDKKLTIDIIIPIEKSIIEGLKISRDECGTLFIENNNGVYFAYQDENKKWNLAENDVDPFWWWVDNYPNKIEISDENLKKLMSI